MHISDEDLLRKVTGLTGALSYNEMIDDMNPKSLIRELCRRMDRKFVRIAKKTDGFLMTNLTGECRYLTFSESLIWRLFNRPPAGVIVVEVY